MNDDEDLAYRDAEDQVLLRMDRLRYAAFKAHEAGDKELCRRRLAAARELSNDRKRYGLEGPPLHEEERAIHDQERERCPGCGSRIEPGQTVGFVAYCGEPGCAHKIANKGQPS